MHTSPVLILADRSGFLTTFYTRLIDNPKLPITACILRDRDSFGGQRSVDSNNRRNAAVNIDGGIWQLVTSSKYRVLHQNSTAFEGFKDLTAPLLVLCTC